MTESEENERTIRVLVFNGTDEVWTMWSKKFLAAGKRRGYKDILTGKVVPPDDSESLDSANTEEAKKIVLREANEKAYNDLLLACSDDVSFSIVGASISEKHPDGDAAKAWKSLTAKFEPDTGTTKVELKREFAESKMGDKSDDPDAWITELEILRQKLGRLGSPIDDDDMIIHILNNLPVEYETIVEMSEKALGSTEADLPTMNDLTKLPLVTAIAQR